jgi:hypothetical protein
VPSLDSIEPLAPDACRSDPSAPSFYCHTKIEALNGGWAKLTDEERQFVGVEVNEHVRPRDGWRSPIALVIDRLGGQMPSTDLHMLERLAGMDTPPQERLGFLG